MKVNEETYQKILKIIDRLSAPIDTSRAGILELPQYYFEFNPKRQKINEVKQ